MKRYLWIFLMVFSLGLSQETIAFPIKSLVNWPNFAAQQVQEVSKTTLNEQNKQKSKENQESRHGETDEKCDFEVTLIELESYKYAQKEMFKAQEATLLPPKKTYEEAKEFVTKNWFAQVDENAAPTGGKAGITLQQVDEIKKQRQAFLQTIGARTLSHATQLRKGIKKDASTIQNTKKNPEQGCNIVQDMAVQNTKLLAVVQQQLVNTTLQLEALELTIARDVLKEDADDKASTDNSPLGAVTGALGEGGLVK